MSKTNAFETAFLAHIFQNAAISNIGNGPGLPASGVAGNLYVALFESDPGEAGAGTEASFTNYARQAVVRSAGGWTVSGNQAQNAAEIAFPQSGSGAPDTMTHFAIFTALTGGDMLFHGVLTAPIDVSNGSTVKIPAGNLTVTED